VLACQGVARAELGEDRDHRLADVLADVLVVGGGEGLLERLEGGRAVAAVPRGEGVLESRAAA
jgi:hypothetical protein